METLLDLAERTSTTAERKGNELHKAPLVLPKTSSSRQGVSIAERIKRTRFPRIETLLYLLTHFQLGELWGKLRSRLYSRTVSYGLSRDLNLPFEPAPARIPITIRPFTPNDIPELLGAGGPGDAKGDIVEQKERMNFLREKIPTCYVGVTNDGKPCYMQWLMSAEQNDRIQNRFNKAYPVLAPDEALVEKVFTSAKYRRLGIMSFAMDQIVKKAGSFNARKVITFVEKNNIASLKGFKKSGFVPYIVRDDRWFLFKRTMTWTPLPCGTKYPFESAQQSHQQEERTYHLGGMRASQMKNPSYF